MIEIRLEDASFEQDIRALVKAMFPQRELRVELGDFKDAKEVKTLTLSVSHTEEMITAGLRDENGKHIERTYEISEENLERKSYKNILKKELYRLLSEYTKKVLPWGTLTGIRPTKIAFLGLNQGKTEEEIERLYDRDYLCSKEKTKLSIDIAKRERKLLEAVGYRNGYSIYIGIPFCPTTCLYCSFTSYPIGRYKKEVSPYLKALMKEIDFAGQIFPDKKLTTVYIGGGTPTSLAASELELLLNYVNEKLPMRDVAEFTVEAGRPDSLDEEKLKVLKRQGVGRISINPQTMVEKTLHIIGRRHSADDVREKFFMAREAGLSNINMDLIIGLPGETIEDVRFTLEELEKLNPDDITVHALAIKRASNLKLKLNELADKMEEDVSAMQELTYQYAREHGYHPYYLYRQKNIADNLENVGFAREGKEGLYNILIMEEKQPIVGLGAGSSSKFVLRDGKRIERTENVKFVNDYIERIDEMIERKKNCLSEFGDRI